MTREEAIHFATCLKNNWTINFADMEEFCDMAIEALSAEAVPIHNDGTLEVKVPNAQKVVRVLVMDTDSHIGGGLFYPAEADIDDLIIKGAKGIQDGLYNIKDGKLFKYKAKGGTVRTYEIVPSADPVQGEWIPMKETLPAYVGGEKTWITGMRCSNCGKSFDLRAKYYFCPNCGAKMLGEDGEEE